MRRIPAVLALILIASMLSGCAVNGEVENQAYALVMGVDSTDDGGIELTIRIPRIGRASEDDGKSGGKGEAYLVIAASGEDYSQALENLQWAVARELNMSHLKLLVVSSSLASGTQFPSLINAIAETRHLYTTAGFIVCEGRAGAFIEGQETLLGNHLATDIEATFRHYAAHGFIPPATFADLYYATSSCYSDPTGIWGFPDPGEKPAAAIIETDEDRLNAETKTASSRQYLGAALFREGQLIATLDAAETLGLNLLTGRVESFGYQFGGRTWTLSSLRKPGVRVEIVNDVPSIRVDVFLTGAQQEGLETLEAAIPDALEALIGKCQAMRVEPFGFAGKAARHFATLGAWQKYDWRARFPGAEVDVRVHLSGPDR